MLQDGRIAVLHLISGLDMGGAEMMLLWSARYHDRRSFRLMVVCLMSGGPIADLIRDEGVDVREMGRKRGRLSPRCLARLLGTIREFAPDIIQGHLFHCNILARILGLCFRKATVVTTRHNEQDSMPRRVAYALTSPLNRATIVFSDRVREHAGKNDPAKRPILMVPYGIDPVPGLSGRGDVRAGLDIPEDVFTWIAVGRLTRQKGFPFLLEAFKTLTQGPGPKPILLVVGEGDDRTNLEDTAARAGLTGQIRFLGLRFDVPDLFSASDAFVLPSLWEGGPLVVLEAMSAGLPVVATDVGDVPTMVRDGESGLVVQPGDTKALARAMARIMELGPEIRKWGEAGRKTVKERFHFSGTQRSLESLYRGLSDSCRGGIGEP